jgi:hypothetical protein
MLESLHLKNVGPAPEMKMELAPRINLITGDNGLGKSFLLDIAWWSLTRRWPNEVNPRLATGMLALPRDKGAASISFSFMGKGKKEVYQSNFDRKLREWSGRPGRPSNPGLVIYAQVDGSFAVWDPARNYWKAGARQVNNPRPPAYVFSPKEVWDGLKGRDGQLERETQLCNGLIQDWANWQNKKGKEFEELSAVLEALSAGDTEPLKPGPLTRISLDDVREMPTLQMPYGQNVPIVHASAGMRRIVSLAYLLVWTWQEHIRASRLLDKSPTKQVTFLIDEIEAHLHPRWQRLIIKSLLSVMAKLSAGAKVQIITATHSPLVLASVEPEFDAKQDAWFDMDLEKTDRQENAQVMLRNRPWVPKGDATSWLISEAFDLPSARSIEAEKILQEASSALKNENISKSAAKKINDKLRSVLSDIDPYWMRWRSFEEKKGWLK